MNKEIVYTLTAPLSHIGEVASTGSYFQTILTSAGKIPVVTGNSIRGRLRDCMASHLLGIIGEPVNKEIFNVLYSGGNIGGALKENVDRARAVREHFPMISLLGGGLNTQIMQGKIQTSFAYPICKETAKITRINDDEMVSWHNLIDEIEFTRTDDAKNDLYIDSLKDADAEAKGKASTQMRYGVQYLAAGTRLYQRFSFSENLTDLEYGAFVAGLAEWFRSPTMGGMAAKGFGTFEADYNHGEITLRKGVVRLSESAQDALEKYEEFIALEGEKYLFLLEGDGKIGKAKNNAD